MRGFSLQPIRARVNRLATSVAAAGCGGSHWRLHCSNVWNDDPVPDWPPADAPTDCACGAELTYRHMVNILIGSPSLPNSGETGE